MRRSQRTAEMVVRPTGLVDPTVEVRRTEGQIDDLLAEVKRRAELGHRSLVTTLTKRFAEDLADYLREYGVKVRYLHSELDAMERIDVLRDLRTGAVDVLVGINLLREGLALRAIARDLEKEMRRLSKELQFEDAARVRDQIIALRKRLAGEESGKEDDADVALAIAAAPKQKTMVRNWRKSRRGP